MLPHSLSKLLKTPLVLALVLGACAAPVMQECLPVGGIAPAYAAAAPAAQVTAVTTTDLALGEFMNDQFVPYVVLGKTTLADLVNNFGEPQKKDSETFAEFGNMRVDTYVWLWARGQALTVKFRQFPDEDKPATVRSYECYSYGLELPARVKAGYKMNRVRELWGPGMEMPDDAVPSRKWAYYDDGAGHSLGFLFLPDEGDEIIGISAGSEL